MYNGTDLELMGKTASRRFVEDGTALNDSIIKVAEQYGLNREQVNRVSEAANIEAYLALNDKNNMKGDFINELTLRFDQRFKAKYQSFINNL